MREAAAGLTPDEAVAHWLKIVGLGIEIFAALVIVAGLAWSTYLYLRRRMGRGALRSLQDPHRTIPAARVGGCRGGRYRQDDRGAAHADEPQRARGPGIDSDLSQLGAGARDRWAVALAETSATRLCKAGAWRAWGRWDSHPSNRIRCSADTVGSIPVTIRRCLTCQGRI